MSDALPDGLPSSLSDATLPPGPGPDETPTQGMLPGPSSGSVGQDARAPAGYAIERELGRGGMGVVYRARSLALQRSCALKMILAGVHSGAAEIERFRTEAQAIARLQHPGIVQVFEIGEHDGRPFMALEFCAGGSLDAKLRAHPLKPREAAALVQALAEAMQAAHAAQVIHRDLKPANVLLTEKGEPKITDFGLAKKLDEEGATQTGSVMGTPSYMPPEQAEGRKDIGPRADVYALGAILYECLTGRPPFKAATPLDTLLQVLTDEPVPLRQLNHQVPMDVETIAHTCLQKDPRKRYATAQALADDLGRYLREEPITARPVGVGERAVKWVKRNRVLSVAAAVVGLTLTAGVAVSSWFAYMAGEEAKAARKAEGVAREESARAVEATSVAQQRADAEAEAKREAQAEKTRADAQLDRVSRLLYAANLAQARRAHDDGNFQNAGYYLSQCDPAHQGWEMDYLFTRNLHGQALVYEEAVTVGSAVFSPDGKRLAQTNAEGVRLVEVATGRSLASLRGDGSTRALVFAPNGQLATAEGQDRTIRIWDAEGRPGVILKESDPVTALAFSPDGRLLASTGWNLPVRLWSPGEGTTARTLPTAPGKVQDVAFSPDGRQLALAGRDGVVQLWEVATGKQVGALEGHRGPIHSVAFSPDGQLLASASADREIRLWSPEKRQLVTTLKGHLRPPLRVAFGPDGRLASADETGLRLWSVATGAMVAELRGETSPGTALSFSPDGRLLASAAATNGTRIWDTRPAPEERVLKAPTQELWFVAVAPGGARVAAVGGDGRLWVWGRDHRIEREIRHPDLRREIPRGRVRHIAFSLDGRLIATINQFGQPLRAWDVATGAEAPRGAGRFPAGTPYAGNPAISPDGRRIVDRGDGNRLTLFETRHIQEVFTLPAPPEEISARAFSADGRWLASAAGGVVRLWSASLSPPTRDLSLLVAASAVGFSADGKQVLAQTRQGDQFAWEVSSFRSVKVTTPFPNLGEALQARSPDGKYSARKRSGRLEVRDESRWAVLRTEMKRRLAEWAKPDPTWHAERAAEAEKAQEWFAAAFHLGRMLREDPDNAELKKRRTQALKMHTGAGK